METRRREVVWRRVGAYVVCVHTDRPPSDEEWSGMVATYAEVADPHALRLLVYTDGGAPNARQRAVLNKQLGQTNPPIAVLTPSALARSVATAISWFNPNVKVFRPHDVEGAFEHLAVPVQTVPVLKQTLSELKSELRAPSVRAAASR